MNICLIGNGLPCLILANILINKNIKISIFEENASKTKFDTRSLGISKKNIEFLKKQKINIEKNAWYINKIKIFNETQIKEILCFGSENDNLFSIIKNFQFIKTLNKNIKKKNLINFIKKKKKVFYDQIIKGETQYDIIINFNENNEISKEIFFNRQKKNYNSLAYTTLIKHQKCYNREAYQVFTNKGPIAFLPLSNTETSIVYSVFNKKVIISDTEIAKLINKYNKKYSIKSFSKIEKFNLKGSILKNYSYKNILCFGDNIHKIHPLAGQGLNMTIRDIKILSKLFDERIELGMSLDKSILKKFENKTKHLNYLYSNSIDFIFDFFKLDSKLNNNYSNKIFKFLDKSALFKKYSTKFADQGFLSY